MKRIALLLVLTVALVGCWREAPERNGPPERIVSLLPSFTQIVVALGAGERIVGCTPFCPREGLSAAAVSVGGALDANFEKILALRPDLVIVQATMTAHIDRLRALGLTVLPQPVETVGDACNAAVTIAKTLGLEKEGRRVAALFRTELKSVTQQTAGKPPVSTLLVIGHTPGELRDIFVAAKGTFLDELLVAAGGVNALGVALTIYPKISKEEILRLNPQVILVFTPTRNPAPDASARELGLWRALPYLDAVKSGRVYVISDFHALSPGTKMGVTAGRISRLLHPQSAVAK